MPIHLEMVDGDEVLRRSFGLVREASFPCPQEREQRRGTLFDPAIFGPERDWECACGAMAGKEHKDSICSFCGVRVGHARSLRETRFGHVVLREAVAHPMFEGCSIDVLPVLPIAYRTDTGEADLDYLYSRVVRAASPREKKTRGSDREVADSVSQAVAALFENEKLERPIVAEGRVVKSLSYYACSDPASSLREVGVFLFAMCVKVAC